MGIVAVVGRKEAGMQCRHGRRHANANGHVHVQHSKPARAAQLKLSHVHIGESTIRQHDGRVREMMMMMTMMPRQAWAALAVASSISEGFTAIANRGLDKT